jgi:L-arabinose isomerase
LLLIHATWVCDTIQYLFVTKLTCPIVLWAVPYTETFSLGCVQHFGSILKQNGFRYWFAYGLPENPTVVKEIGLLARTAALAESIRRARIALIGPRQTWRVANSQDMVKEEWDFSKKFGSTIVHVEMDELIDAAGAHSEQQAERVLNEMKHRARMGTINTSRERLLHAAKVYLGLKDLFARYRLTAATAECYPKFGGLVNLPSSWLADEGLVLDTEGDIGHTLLMTALCNMGAPGAVALAEVGRIDEQRNWLDLAHEGSSAHSLAAHISQVSVQDGGDGTIVGFPYRALPQVTVTQMVGTGDRYKVLIARASTEKISHDEWVEGGSKLMVRIRVDHAANAFQRMLDEGLDHHLLVKAGDVTKELHDLCTIFVLEDVVL